MRNRAFSTAEMRLRDVIQRAFVQSDAKLAGQIANKMRFEMRMTYDAMMVIVEECGIEAAEWDSLLAESDEIDSYS